MWVNSVHIQELANKEKQQSLLLEQLNEVSQIYYELQGTFLSAFLDRSESENKHFELERANFSADIDRLLTNAAFTPNQRDILKELQRFADLEDSMLKQGGDDPTENKWMRFVRLRHKFLAMLNSRFQFRKEYKEFLLPQRMELDRLQKKQQSEQQAFLILLISGVSGNLIMVLIVHFLFSRYITAKVSTLVTNARDLSEEKNCLLL